MNLRVTSLGSYGDIYPLVGLAVHLKQLGHNLTLFTNPFFEQLANKYGLEFVPIGTLVQYEQFARHPDLFNPRKSLSVLFEKLIIPNIRTAYECLIDHIQRTNTVIVSSIIVGAARLVQGKYHVPNNTLHLTPMAIKSAYEMPKNAMFLFLNWLPLSIRHLYWWVADTALADSMISPLLNTFRKHLGLPP